MILLGHAVPPFLRYGKYCGIMYSGCPGEQPCDGLDACCMKHDLCIQHKGSKLFTLHLNCPHSESKFIFIFLYYSLVEYVATFFLSVRILLTV